MGQMPDTNKRFDELPKAMQSKIRKKYDFLSKKHPKMPAEQVFEKIARKMGVKFNWE